MATGLVLVAAVLYAGVLVHQNVGRVSPPMAKSLSTRPLGDVPGGRAPNFSLVSLTGTKVSLASHYGHPVWINFWATWCPNCRQELALIQHENTLYGSKLVIMGVDMEQCRQAVARFVHERDLTYSVLLDPQGAVSAAYGIKGLPTSVFVSRRGVVKAVLEGGIRTPAIAQFYLKKILG